MACFTLHFGHFSWLVINFIPPQNLSLVSLIFFFFFSLFPFSCSLYSAPYYFLPSAFLGGFNRAGPAKLEEG